MRRHIDRLTGIASIALGVGTAASAILGPLVTNVIRFHVSENASNQLIGGEIVSLCVAAPLAIASGVLWLRGRALAPKLAIGPALYALYTNMQFLVGPQYRRYAGNNEYAIPLYLGLIVIGGVIVVRAWRKLVSEGTPSLSVGMRRGLAGVLIVLALFFALTWVRGIAEVIGGKQVTEYQQDPTLFWLIRLMDLVFVIPAALIAGIGLLRGTAWAERLSYVITSFLTLEVGAVAGMAAAMVARDDPSASVSLLVLMLISALTLAALLIRVLWSSKRPVGARRPTLDPLHS